MELRILKYFIAVAEHGSISAAAREVHVAQPSISRQIRQLEQNLGAALFERGYGGLTLTPAGERFRPVAEDLIWRHETASRLFTDPSSYDRRFLVVAHSTTEKRVLAPFSAEKRLKYPRTDVINETPLSVFSTVDAIHADVGVTTIAPPTGWEVKHLSQVPLLAQVPKDHSLARVEYVDVERLLSHPLILMSSAHSARTTFDQAVSNMNRQSIGFTESHSSLMAQVAAASGRGVAIVTDEAAFGLHSIRITHQNEPLSFPLYAGWKRLHYASAEIHKWAQDLARWITSNAELSA